MREQVSLLSPKSGGLLLNPKSVKVGRTPNEIVYREGKLTLRHYFPKRDGPFTNPLLNRQFPTPLLMVYALVNRPYILDLLPGRSVVEYFLNSGIDVYLVDWGVPDDEDCDLGLKDYINGYLNRCVGQVKTLTGSSKISLFGYCQGGTFATIYTALYPEDVKNLVLLAAPIDFKTEGLLNLWSRKEYFDLDKLVDVYGNIPASIINGAFAMLRPVQNFMDKYVQFGWDIMEGKTNEESIEHFMAMEKWLSEGIPQAGEAFREFIKDLYQDNLLIQNRMKVGEKAVDLKKISCSLMNILAAKDHIIPPESGEPLNRVVASNDKEVINFPSGHVGLSVGKRAQTDLWPKVINWVVARSRS